MFYADIFFFLVRIVLQKDGVQHNDVIIKSVNSLISLMEKVLLPILYFLLDMSLALMFKQKSFHHSLYRNKNRSDFQVSFTFSHYYERIKASK